MPRRQADPPWKKKILELKLSKVVKGKAIAFVIRMPEDEREAFVDFAILSLRHSSGGTLAERASAVTTLIHNKALGVPQPAIPRSTALGNEEVDIMDKFPNVRRQYSMADPLYSIANMRGTLAPCSKEIPDATLQLIIQRLFERVLTLVEDYSYAYEAGIVQLLRGAFHECGHALGLTAFQSSIGCSVTDDVMIEEATSTSNGTDRVSLGVLSGIEWWLHLGKAFKGQMELHFLKQRDAKTDAEVFIGAVKVGIGIVGSGIQQKVKQAEKELLAMSFYNAFRGHHHDVWVVLTDGRELTRMQYSSDNRPGTKYPVYQEGMACNRIYGEFKCTNGMRLWDSLPECGVVDTTAKAVLVMLGGLLDSPLLIALTSAEAMKEHAANSQKAIKKRALEASQNAMCRKRSRTAASATV